MGFIRESEGVDFIIESRSLTAEGQVQITEYIKAYKAKEAKKAA